MSRRMYAPTAMSGSGGAGLTEAQINAMLATKADASQLVTINNTLNNKADTSLLADKVSATEVGVLIQNKADITHVHTIAGISGLQPILDDKVSKTERFPFNLVISATTNRYTLTAAGLSGYTPGKSDVVLTINNGVSLYSDDTTKPALDIDATWNIADTISIVNNGVIIGSGGKGGATGSDANGAKGGDAIRTAVAISVTNNGTIAGGGGGGGAGGGGLVDGSTGVGGGGGGGQGYFGGLAGSINGSGSGPYAYYRGPQSGTAGSNAGAGTGGVGSYGHGGYVSPNSYMAGGSGGSGGLLGMPGSNGGSAVQSGENIGSYSIGGGAPIGQGGAAGSYIVGNSKVTWISPGIRKGNVS